MHNIWMNTKDGTGMDTEKCIGTVTRTELPRPPPHACRHKDEQVHAGMQIILRLT